MFNIWPATFLWSFLSLLLFLYVLIFGLDSQLCMLKQILCASFLIPNWLSREAIGRDLCIFCVFAWK